MHGAIIKIKDMVGGFLLIWLLFFMFIGVSIVVFDYQEEDIKTKVSLGNIYEFSEEKDYLSDIADYCVNNGFIYLLYNRKGVVQIYNTSGKYIKSFGFFPRDSGRAGIYCLDAQVILEDQDHNYYSFNRDEYTGYELFSTYDNYLEKQQILDSQPNKRSDSSGYYFLRLGSIYHNDREGNTRLIVKKPFLAFRISFYALLLTVGFLLIIKSIALWWPNIVGLFDRRSSTERR